MVFWGGNSVVGDLFSVVGGFFSVAALLFGEFSYFSKRFAWDFVALHPPPGVATLNSPLSSGWRFRTPPCSETLNPPGHHSRSLSLQTLGGNLVLPY